MSSPLRRRDLILPLAAIGLAGGGLTADAFDVGHLADDSARALRLLLCVLTPLSCAGLGAWLAPRLHGSVARTFAAVLGGTLVAGALNGILIGICIGAGFGAILGATFGLFSAVAFVPAIGLVALAWRRIGRARPGTIVDGADRRGVLRAALVAIAVGSLLVRARTHTTSLDDHAHAVLVAATLAMAALTAVELGALARVSLLVRALRGEPTRACTSHDEHACVYDFGVGDEAVEVVRPATYRDPERAIRVFRGSAARARTALVGALVIDLVLASAGAIASWRLLPW